MAVVLVGPVVLLAAAAVVRAVEGGPSSAPAYDLTASSAPAETVPVTVGAALLPGGSVARNISVDNETGHAINAVRLSVRSVHASESTSDRSRGVQLEVLYCGATTRSGSAHRACSSAAGGPAVGWGPLVGARTIRLAAPLAAAHIARFELVFGLPDDAPGSMQGLTSSLDYTFTSGAAS